MYHSVQVLFEVLFCISRDNHKARGSLGVEESSRTGGALDVDAWKERFNMKNTHRYIFFHSRGIGACPLTTPCIFGSELV